jgi:hypothetical protein
MPLPEKLPNYDELPAFHEYPGCAWDVWGKGDQLGTINLLTPEVVQKAAQEEIRTGRSVSLNWPINFPSRPCFSRRAPNHFVFVKRDGGVHDDELYINTQSSSQWDGLKHFSVLKYGAFYQNHLAGSFHVGDHPLIKDPNNVDPDLIKLGIHNWAQHGICSRGVLLDLHRFLTADGTKELPYDPWTTYPINLQTLLDCAEHQGVQFRTGDILIVRMGFMVRYEASSQEEKDTLVERL